MPPFPSRCGKATLSDLSGGVHGLLDTFQFCLCGSTAAVAAAEYQWRSTCAASRQRRSNGGNSQAQAKTPAMCGSLTTLARAALYAAACSTWSTGAPVEACQGS